MVPESMSTAIDHAPTNELAPYKWLDNDELARRINAVRESLGSNLLILEHHYQQVEVIALSDLRGA